MLNKQKGNMYPWVTHTWNPIKGRCPHECAYCYMKRYWYRLKEPHLDEKSLKDNLGYGNVIFVGSSIDMWADEIPDEWIVKILDYLNTYPDNIYLFQSKNPHRFALYFQDFPPNVILGTTIETNRNIENITKAPSPVNRYMHMLNDFPRKMVSIEPIMDFDLDEMVRWIEDIQPTFVSIGADSKGNNLPEPPSYKIKALIDKLEKITEVRIKKNLGRLINESCR